MIKKRILIQQKPKKEDYLEILIKSLQIIVSSGIYSKEKKLKRQTYEKISHLHEEIKDLMRKTSVANLRLSTRHDCLVEHSTNAHLTLLPFKDKQGPFFSLHNLNRNREEKACLSNTEALDRRLHEPVQNIRQQEQLWL